MISESQLEGISIKEWRIINKEFKEYLKLFKYDQESIHNYFNDLPIGVNEHGEPLLIRFTKNPNIELAIKLNFSDLKGKETISKIVQYRRKQICPS